MTDPEQRRREAKLCLMAEMALLRAPASPLLASLPATSASSARGLIPAANATQFGGILRSRSAVGGEVQKRSRLRSEACRGRASGGEDRRGNAKEPRFPPPGELQYFGKLSAGCVVGAFLVKYGSLCVPSITTPNINVALMMITSPCLVSVVLLALASLKRNTRKQ